MREGVEGADVGGRRHAQHRHWQCGHQRLVEMQDVEALLFDQRRDPVRKMKAQGDAGDRIVDRDRDWGADAVEARAVEVDVRATRGSEDARLVAERLESYGEVADVVVD